MMPRTVSIEASTMCNIHCTCCTATPMPHPDLMSWDTFLAAAELMGPGCIVMLNARGEPLMHPKLEAMVAVARERGAHPHFHTNGTLLTPQRVGSLRRAGLESITVSIFGATKETHERLQRGAVSEIVWEGVRLCVEAGLHTAVAFVVMRSNLEELEAYIRKASAIGVAQVTLIRMAGNFPDEDPFIPSRREQTLARLQSAEQLGATLGIQVWRLGRFDLEGVCSAVA
jgi:MoaA/NifB/PqqE/SkfB family radical SAM enzyme